MTKIGILGGGQLALMLGMSAKISKCEVVIYSDISNCPANFICDKLYVGDYDNLKLLNSFVNEVDTVIFEFENVSLDALKHVDQSKLFAKLDILKISSNRILEKNLAKSLNLNTPTYYYGSGLDELNKCIYEKPMILKTTTMGYDGKGQRSINSNNDLSINDNISNGEWILEEKINFDFEGSVIFYKLNNSIYNYDAFKNVSVNGILMETTLLEDNQIYFDYFKPLVEAIDFNGIICIEFFKQDDKIFFNEIAPRVHNSGHITLKSHLYSQFDNLINLILGYPIDNTRLTNSLVMKQVLGQDYETLKNKVNFFDYLKDEVKIDRKMGHYITKKEDEND